ncbi:hypothetical protein AS156_11185 [Bradyrhizobium macuxiense]|uniref:Uncharacterized protein n=1 Tax=Bradyrhizobium macuxiense TaxID=1755647 RepID=A0A109JN52_9BRAD|nr:hypothetical protein AS156_11185 [Bradyrhizobium macuxiense]
MGFEVSRNAPVPCRVARTSIFASLDRFGAVPFKDVMKDFFMTSLHAFSKRKARQSSRAEIVVMVVGLRYANA